MPEQETTVEQLRREVKALEEFVRSPAGLQRVQEAAPGMITAIDSADSSLLEVNVGAEFGLEKHATLEVFRVSAAEEYVGALWIFEVYPHRAVCRLLSTNPLTRPTVHVGDLVRCQRN